ncbi:hypothetical protein, partial [Bradyrhizobium sp. Leaf396]|uniref:hypothetical protein n=1 Tax=Bradyrhizobium sp. Leaf396 TaxID=1736363 RepID=UPI001AECB457
GAGSGADRAGVLGGEKPRDRGLTRLSGAPVRADEDWPRSLPLIPNDVSRDLLRRAKQEHDVIIAS